MELAKCVYMQILFFLGFFILKKIFRGSFLFSLNYFFFKMTEEQLFDALKNIWTILWIWFLMPSGIFAAISGGGTSTNFGNNKMDIEIRAYRLQQYEISGKVFGSKSWKVCLK